MLTFIQGITSLCAVSCAVLTYFLSSPFGVIGSPAPRTVCLIRKTQTCYNPSHGSKGKVQLFGNLLAAEIIAVMSQVVLLDRFFIPDEFFHDKLDILLKCSLFDRLVPDFDIYDGEPGGVAHDHIMHTDTSGF